MDKFDLSSINSAQTLSFIASANEEFRQQMEREEQLKALRISNPIVEQLSGLIEAQRKQNYLLEKQVTQLEEEKQRQVELTNSANKSARHAKIQSIVISGITIAIAFASLLVSILR